jgi:predicted ATPase/class 3 adenylate cyclase
MMTPVRPDLPSGTVTFLFSDVEGSTRLLHELGAEAYAGALAQHRRVVRETCAPQGGVEVDTQGDAFFFAFAEAPAAVAAAQAIRDALAQGPIHLRIGLHTGTPLVTDEGYVGDDVHFAARVGASAHGDQIVLSESTRALVAGVSLTDLGEHRLKDIADSVSIFQVGSRTFPPLKTISNTNLPRPASSFVGREAELSEVLARFERGTRLLTLTGPGGSGKTRLAVEAALTLVPDYKAGVFWVGLASLRDPALVSETIAQVVGAKDDLASHVAERELLLLLDNLEQVIEAAPELAQLLSACPNLTLLVTSRELLRVSGEVEYPVPPLASPEAVSLFCERSALEASPEIAELCTRLDDLPLAVELAAARTKALTPAQITERLSGWLDLLKGGRDADPRQQTLRATIGWSYELLSPEEQELFARLSVFSGGCTLEAAEQVAGADLDTLQSIVEKSLLRFTGGRYWMLETIREYAAETLFSREAADGVAKRHLDFYLSRAREFAEQSETGNYQLGQIDAERDNLRVALDTALAVRPSEAVELAGCLRQYWIDRGHFREGRARTAAALAAAADVPAAVRARALRVSAALAAKQADLDEAERLGREALSIYRAIQDAKGAGSVLNVLGVVAWYRGDLSEATRLLEEALSEYDAIHEKGGRNESPVAHARRIATSNLAAVAAAAGDHARAIEAGREIVSSTRGQDDFALVIALNSLGMALEATGQTGDARRCFEEAIVLSRSRGFTEALAYVLASLAHLELQRTPLDALGHYQESLALMQEMGETRGAAYCLEGLGAVALSRGGAVDAATLLGAASKMRKQTGASLDPDGLAEVNRWVGEAAEALGLETFRASWSCGIALSVDQAVEFGLSLTGEQRLRRDS